MPAAAPPLVLLHWGDLKAGKGRAEALAVLESLVGQGVPPALAGWGLLFHRHSQVGLELQLLQRAEAAGIGLVRLEGEIESGKMQHWLARCPVALLAYDPRRYGQPRRAGPAGGGGRPWRGLAGDGGGGAGGGLAAARRRRWSRLAGGGG